MNSGHGLVAHSPQVLLYSTKYSKNHDCTVNVQVRALIDPQHNNQSKDLIQCVHLHLALVGKIIHLSPAVTQCTHTCHLFWMSQLTSPGSEQYPQP